MTRGAMPPLSDAGRQALERYAAPPPRAPRPAPGAAAQRPQRPAPVHRVVRGEETWAEGREDNIMVLIVLVFAVGYLYVLRREQSAAVGLSRSIPAVAVIMSCSTVCPLHGSMRQLPSL